MLYFAGGEVRPPAECSYLCGQGSLFPAFCTIRLAFGALLPVGLPLCFAFAFLASPRVASFPGTLPPLAFSRVLRLTRIRRLSRR